MIPPILRMPLHCDASHGIYAMGLCRIAPRALRAHRASESTECNSLCSIAHVTPVRVFR